MEILKMMAEEFTKAFGHVATTQYFSPGRINLIGEHTDYNGGHVFPCAISLGTYALVAPREDQQTRLLSLNIPDKKIITIEMTNLQYDADKSWANYPMGVIAMLAEAGFTASHGFDILFYGTLPNGAGLSSSASIEVLTAVILDDAFGWNIDMVELVKLAQRAENKFVGVNCGIMDQFAVGMGQQDKAILLDCNTLEYRYSNIALDGYSIVITNTNKKHSLGDSAYNERRSQCEHALSQLQEHVSIKSLGELTPAQFDTLAQYVTDPIERQRAKHAVYENARTLEAIAKLEENDIAGFGKLMNASHISLRDDYDVTGIELDTLAELAWKQPGVLGSRMTGAGFGGCTISIVENKAIDAFKEAVAQEYTAKIGYAPSFYVANIANGASKI